MHLYRTLTLPSIMMIFGGGGFIINNNYYARTQKKNTVNLACNFNLPSTVVFDAKIKRTQLQAITTAAIVLASSISISAYE